jgi:hypothetical protein
MCMPLRTARDPKLRASKSKRPLPLWGAITHSKRREFQKAYGPAGLGYKCTQAAHGTASTYVIVVFGMF